MVYFLLLKNFLEGFDPVRSCGYSKNTSGGFRRIANFEVELIASDQATGKWPETR
jgi:hypothetical protein